MNATTPIVTSLADEQLEQVTRYQIINQGRMWHIVDRMAGRTVGFCGSYRAAVRRVEQIEARADSFDQDARERN